MTIMDLKAGSWVGDMYEKFEAMCVEAEEVMYEDTFKYVENQVRTVGETVKKFYSDVIEDLLPPSPSNGVKSEDALSSPKIPKKPKVVLHENESEKLMKDSSVTSCSPISRVIKPCRPKSIYPFGEKSSKDNSLSQGTELLISSRKASFEVKHPSSLKDSKEKCLSNFIELHNRSDELTNVNEGNLSIVDLDKVKMRNPLSGPITIDLNEHLSTDLGSSSTQSDLVTTFTSSVENTIEMDKELSTFDIETSSPFLNMEYRKCEGDEEGFVVEKLNEVKLEESCVLVEKNDSFSKSNLQNVQKSYKKKIRDVLSPRKWSKSKQDQEQLADWYNEQCGKTSVSTKSLMSESFELDWELL